MRLQWGWWVPVVIGLSLPVFGFTRHPQWARVHLIPFTDPEDKLRDQLANVGMLLPLGYLYASRRPLPRGLVGAVGWAAAVSIAAEATQLFSTERNPSATDVAMAMCGAGVGAVIARLTTNIGRN